MSFLACARYTNSMVTLRISSPRCAICMPVSLLVRAQTLRTVLLTTPKIPSLISCFASITTSWQCVSSWAPISSTLCYMSLLARNRDAIAKLGRELGGPLPSARERDPEQATDTVGHPCRHRTKEQLPHTRGEYVPTRKESNGGADQKEGEGTH